MKKMNKNQKYGIIAAVAIVVVVLAATWVGQSDVFQGRLKGSKPDIMAKYNGPFFKYKNKYVTPVASPVTSVVLSTVTSQGGPSIVASAVTSPVASPVQLAQSALQGVNLSTVPVLTAAVLNSAARADYLKNPAKYTLSDAQKKRIIDAYKSKYPNAFRITR